MALAAKVIALVTSSSPGPEAGGERRAVQGGRAGGERDRVGRVAALGDGLLERLHVRALGQPVAAQDLVDRGDVVVVDRLSSVRDRHGGRG